jgi:hypothetical protein
VAAHDVAPGARSGVRKQKQFANVDFQIQFSPLFETKVHLAHNSKVEDHLSLYNFCKGC